MEIGKFRKQYKGKDLGKVPKSKLLQNGWYVGIKYDGNYCQVHKRGARLWMFTSTGQPFMVSELRDELLIIDSDFIIECEFNNNSDGITLNDRTKSSTGTPRANFKKGIACSMPNASLRVFDIIYLCSIEGQKLLDTECNFQWRRHRLSLFPTNLKRVKPVNFIFVDGLEDCRDFARELINDGGEGAFAFHETHTIKDKGRSNLAIKLKADNQVEMVCVGATLSETVENEWGALLLRDDNGLVQAFGGLTDELRRTHPYVPAGRFNVKYESFTDGKYIQGFINGK